MTPISRRSYTLPMPVDKLISADSHVVEPPDLWDSRIDAAYKDRRPRMYRDGAVHRWVADNDINVGSLGAPSQAGRRFVDPDSLTIEAPFQDTPEAAYEPHARVKAMAVDGVVGEVIYPTIAVRLVETDIDSALMSACFRAMNDWMADFSTAYPDSIKGSGVVNVDDIDDALSEIERCAKLGLAGITIPAYPGEGRTYDLPRYEQFWALAQDLGLPLAMHSGSYRPGPGVIGSFANDITVGGTSSFRASEDYWPRRAIGDMMFSGVFERFPRLTVGAVEFELGWAAYFIQQMDRHYADHHYVKEIQFIGDYLPGDLFRRNIFVTFQEDVAGIATRHVVGVDNILWSSDYPHTESTWPNSLPVLNRLLSDVPQDEAEKMAFGNAARVYGFG